ncbi:hypothetical protein F4810DRAFT_273498 [Camillea tinctor]|nr:hypothetical protein F4810DRAFT_273498 [Camillea tinctor]
MISNPSSLSALSLPQAKHKAKRSSIQASIASDHAVRLAALRRRIETHYQRESQKTIQTATTRLTRLTTALDRRLACEDSINRVLCSVREDCAHVAMLLGALYSGRLEGARKAGAAVGEVGEEKKQAGGDSRGRLEEEEGGGE